MCGVTGERAAAKHAAMPATPAWPPQSTPRLFVEQQLGEGQVRIDGPSAHYLAQVMRIRVGDPVKLFDNQTGEWLGVAASVGKRDVLLDVTQLLRPREPVPDLWLCSAPIKKARNDWAMEKACELGVDKVVPVLTRRAVVDKLNLERVRGQMIEAAEQCGRTALPSIVEPVKLPALLRSWDPSRKIFFADETGGVPALAAMQANPGPAALLVGPEGGFDHEERELILARPEAVSISLGPRILRAETAVAATISLWMAAQGDW